MMMCADQADCRLWSDNSGATETRKGEIETVSRRRDRLVQEVSIVEKKNSGGEVWSMSKREGLTISDVD